MKITEILTHPLTVTLEEKTWTAHEEHATRTSLLVEVRTDEGITGYGQIASRPMELICEYVKQFGEVVSGMDPRETTEVWERLFGLTSPRPGAIGGKDGLPPPVPRGQRLQAMAAIGGIDIALWDIKGKAAGVPVYRLLGGKKRPVFTYATGGYYVPGEPLTACAARLARFVEHGYDAVKLKTGAEPLDVEVERIRATREAIGEKTLLMLDQNASYSPARAPEMVRALEPYDIFWLEETLHWYCQPQDFARLAAASPIPLAHGERELTRFPIRDFIDSGALGFVQFDATRAAGFTESLRIAHYAEQRGVRLAPHAAPEIHIQLVAAFPEEAGFCVESHGDATQDPIGYDLFREGPELRDGHLHPTDLPGMGFEVDWDFVETHRA